MNDSNTLNSTEKLLDTIRRKNPLSADNAVTSDQGHQSAVSVQKNIKHSLTAGVCINKTAIFLVLTGAIKPESKKELVKWERVQIPEGLNIKSSGFPDFLKTALSGFLGKKNKKATIWTAIDSKYIKLRNITIPDLHESKTANAALWGLKKEFELNTDEEIFDYAYIDDTIINGAKKKNIVAFSGDKKQVRFIESLFSAAGFPLTGITAIPFALQNFVRATLLQVDASPIVFANIARHHSEITCLSAKGILLTRSIRTGSQSLVEELIESEDQAFSHDNIPDILSSGFERNSTEFAAIEHPANRLLGKITRTGEYCSNTLAGNTPVSKFYFFGETDNCPAFMAYAAEQISVDIERFSPFKHQFSISLPENAVQRNRIIPAAGIALSSNDYTPNFLRTYLHKSIEAKYKRMNLIVAAVCLVCLIGCAGVWAWFNTQKNNEIGQLAAIEKKLSGYTPLITTTLLDQKTTGAVEKTSLKLRYAQDYLPLAVLNEIFTLTPGQVYLMSLTTTFHDDSIQNRTRASNQIKIERSVTIQGIVKSEYTQLESVLTGYIIKLNDSPLFDNITLKDKKFEKTDAQSGLTFSVNMEIL